MKTITARADGNRAKLRANIDTYVSQTCEYVKSIRANFDARQAVCGILGMSNIRSTSGLLICGTSNDRDAPILTELISEREPRIRYMYYDKLYEKLCDAYARSRKQYVKVGKSYEGTEGVHLTVMASISPDQVHDCAYLIDIGGKRENRVSIVVSGSAYVKILDAAGRQIEARLEIEFGAPQVFQIEFSNSLTHGFLSVSCNNGEVVNLQRQDGYQNALSMENAVIGSDLNGKLGACCILGATILRYRTLGIKEKLELLGFLSRRGEAGGGIEFNGNQHLRRGFGGGFVQEAKEARPIFRKSLYYSD